MKMKIEMGKRKHREIKGNFKFADNLCKLS